MCPGPRETYIYIYDIYIWYIYIWYIWYIHIFIHIYIR
jgi:hypothetical protein